MKRGLTTLLATAAFLAGHFAARLCLATMSLPAPSAPAHSCCHKHVPEAPKAPAPKACCCSEGANLAVTDESAPTPAPDGGIVVEVAVDVSDSAAAVSASGGRAPPGWPSGVPLYALFATLLI